MSGERNKRLGAEGAVMLASEIIDNKALSSLSLSKNALLTKEAGKVIGDMLKGNSTLKELDLSSNYDYDAGATDGPGFAQELADGMKDNGALSYLNLASNAIGKLVLPEGWSEKYGDATSFGYTHGDTVMAENRKRPQKGQSIGVLSPLPTPSRI
jgi:hypothetical protein